MTAAGSQLALTALAGFHSRLRILYLTIDKGHDVEGLYNIMCRLTQHRCEGTWLAPCHCSAFLAQWPKAPAQQVSAR